MFPLKFSLALILGFVKFDKCAHLVVPAQPTYVPRLKVLFPALPPLFLFHGDLKFSKSSVSALQDKMVPHPSCQPFFSYSSVWYRSVTFFHLSKFRTCMSLLCFPCRLISCFSLPVDKWYLRRSVLTINQSLNFLFEAFLFLLLSSGFDVIPAWFGWRPTKLIVCSEHSVSFPTSTCHLIYSPSQTPSVQLFALNANPILELESIPVACLFPTSFRKN